VPDTVRADIGVTAGSEVGIHYDSMLGKIIAHAPTRAEAAQLLRRALEETWVPGLVTNREQLAKILGHRAFLAGELDTHFLERHAGELATRAPGLGGVGGADSPPQSVRVAVVGLALHGIAQRRTPDALTPPGWRNVPFADQQITYKLGDADVVVGYRPTPDGGVALAIGGKITQVSRFDVAGDRVSFVEGGGHLRRVRVASAGARHWVLSEGLQLLLVEEPRFPDAQHAHVAGGLVAPMPGKVVKVLVEAGAQVPAGAALVVLEAMKMEHTVRTQIAGTVSEIFVTIGQQVDGDHLLAVVSEDA